MTYYVPGPGKDSEVNMQPPVVAEPLTRTREETNNGIVDFEQARLTF